MLLACSFVVDDLLRKSPNAFRAFYFAASAIETGEDIYTAHAPEKEQAGYIYPPLFAVMITPLLHLRLTGATRLWLFVNVGLTWIALLIAAREIARRLQLSQHSLFLVAIACGAFLLSAGEIKTEWSTGQTDTLILLVFTLALAWIDKYPVLAGLALGFGANIKYQTICAVPYLLARRRWRAAVSTLTSAVGISLLPSLIIGWQRNLDDLKKAFAGLGLFAGIEASTGAAHTEKLTWTRSVSITSAIARLLDSLGVSPAKSLLVVGVIAVLCLGIAWWMYKCWSENLFAAAGPEQQREQPAVAMITVEWLGLIVAWLVFGPEVSRRHMFVLLLLNVVAIGVLVAPRPFASKSPLLIGLILFQLGLRLPPAGKYFSVSSDIWKGIGGPSWCLLLLYGTLLWTTLSLSQSLKISSSRSGRT